MRKNKTFPGISVHWYFYVEVPEVKHSQAEVEHNVYVQHVNKYDFHIICCLLNLIIIPYVLNHFSFIPT